VAEPAQGLSAHEMTSDPLLEAALKLTAQVASTASAVESLRTDTDRRHVAASARP
jgi:hypothetical protein